MRGKRLVQGTHYTADELAEKGAAYLAAQKAKRARDAAQWEARKESERAEMRREEEAAQAAAEALKRMTPAQQAQHFARPNSLPIDLPKLPAGRRIVRDAIRMEDEEAAAAELRQREAEAGLPDDQAKWQADQQAIIDERNAELDDIDERAEADRRAAREKADRRLAALGSMPSLDTLEVAA